MGMRVPSCNGQGCDLALYRKLQSTIVRKEKAESIDSALIHLGHDSPSSGTRLCTASEYSRMPMRNYNTLGMCV
jgi:hypothetical protein